MFLQRFVASSEPCEGTVPISLSAPRRGFLGLPLEILENIFEQTILDSDPAAWDFVGPSTLYGNETLALCPTYISSPTIAHVNRYVRSALLAHLSRSTIFRIDISISLEELTQGTPWLRLLDPRRECGIRRLQVRLSKDDSRGKKANLNLRYFAHAREWKIELVVDQGFEDEDGPRAEAKAFAARIKPCKPNAFEVDTLRTLLEKVRYLLWSHSMSMRLCRAKRGVFPIYRSQWSEKARSKGSAGRPRRL